jgi:hypothetical protein
LFTQRVNGCVENVVSLLPRRILYLDADWVEPNLALREYYTNLVRPSAEGNHAARSIAQATTGI